MSSGQDCESRTRLVTIWRSVAAAQPWTPAIMPASTEGAAAVATAAAAAASSSASDGAASSGASRAASSAVSFGALGANVDALAESLKTLFEFKRGDGSKAQLSRRGVGVAVPYTTTTTTTIAIPTTTAAAAAAAAVVP